jgi:hypothetical protein
MLDIFIKYDIITQDRFNRIGPTINHFNSREIPNGVYMMSKYERYARAIKVTRKYLAKQSLARRISKKR